MVLTESAKMIDAEELKASIDDETALNNPTVERLIFVETRGKDGAEGKLFPCYVDSYGYDDLKPGNGIKSIRFRCALTQYNGQEFGMVYVGIRERELGVSKRFWDKPPKKSVRDETPWIEEGVQ